MKISDLVEQIIAKRNGKLPIIERKKEELQQMLTLLDEFEYFKSEVVDAEGNVIDGKYKVIADRNPEMAIKLNVLSTAECKKRIKVAMDECEKVCKRFNRESINIAVIGKARVGKSEFLKSISNLSNYVIPAFAETDCTGAVSIIENKPGVKLEAEFTFKTEEQIIAIVQTYLDRIIPDEENRIVIRNIYQIRDLDLNEVNNRKVHGRAENNLVPYLAKFVEHYEEWASLVKQQSLVLYDEKEIQEYVAQNNGKKDGEGKVSFYKYLAVDTCKISCTFDYQEAGKITLVDTVGFEDNAIGIEDELIRVVNDKSDAVVFVLFPLDGAGGGVPAKISDIYSKIEKSCTGKNLDKWLFWLINHAPNHPKTPNPIEFCQQALKTLDVNSWSGEIRKIVDVANQEQVREEFLIPLLNTLMSNLDEIDNLYLEDLKSALTDVQKEYSSFCSSAKKLMTSKLGNSANAQPQMVMEIDKMFNRLTAQLKSLSGKEKEKRDVSCDILKNRVTGIIESLQDGTFVPSTETLREELACSQPQTVYMNYCNKIRTEITQRFSEVDGSLKELVDMTKNSIANILISDEGCKLGRVLNPSGEQQYEWLKQFAENVLDEETYKNLYPAFKNVYNFDFSVKGFLTYEVRACLDAIDPELTDIPQLLGATDVDTVNNIGFWIERKLIDVSDELSDKLTDLFRKPHRAFFAIIKEFSDKVVYSESVKYEWNRLFMENYPIIWAEDYKNMAIEAASFEEWSELLKKLLEFNSKSETFAM
ncbi:MAG: hypothetical protein IKA17_02005 [Clostridia bacterium]|nr:hypothetical protein [Clostridia bacterium]